MPIFTGMPERSFIPKCMSEIYKIGVDETWTFELEESKAESLDFVHIEGQHDHILEGYTPYRVDIVDADPLQKRYRVVVNNTSYSVRISDALDQQIEKMGFQLQSTRSISKIEAPMPGLILSVEVSEGQDVREGDTLLVLEAMKMENAILSPQNGTIKKVWVAKGDAVDKKKLLIEFE